MIASGNPGKLREIRRMFAGRNVSVVGKDDLGIDDASEDHHTFLENALAKARYVALKSGEAALADDSGICVRALLGKPGVRSARYCGHCDDKKNNELLASKMEGVEDRVAHYHCSLVLLRSADDPAPLVTEARWHGRIATRAMGRGGFGYDPLFDIGDGRTAAQIDPAEKDRISHRGKALRSMLELLGREPD